MNAELPPIDLSSEPSFPLGPHVVHPSTREIATRNARITLEPRVMQVLVALSQQRGATVSRDRLIARCWGGVVVGEDSIQRCIGRLRKAGEAIGGFEIETLSRIGYRLHADPAVPDQTSATTSGPVGSVSTETRRTTQLLAVLPFDNLSTDPGLSYLADGVAEDILQTIARTSTITAVGRTSSFQFRGAAKVVAQIEEALGVTHILDGSVQRAGLRVRVSAHLMDVAEQTMLWSDRFEGVVDDLFQLQDRVAAAVVGVLHGTFHSFRGTRTVDVEANDVAMRVRDLLNTPTFLRDHGGRELIARLEACITPQSAEAWALIATAQAALRWTADDEDAERLRQQAAVAIDRALAIDPLCGEAHKARYLLAPPAGHFTESESALTATFRTVPKNGEVRWALFLHGLAVGCVRDAAAHAEAAYAVDPLRPPNVTAYGIALHAIGETASAMSLFEDAVERWPDDPNVLAQSAWAAACVGDMARVDRLMAHHRPERYAPAGRALTERALFAAQAYRHPGSGVLEEAERRVRRDLAEGRPRFSLVALWANLGADLDEIYDIVTPASAASLCVPEARLGPLDGLAHLFLPANARLRQTPRFVELCRALGLVDYWASTGSWPDCVDEVASVYDFIEMARRDRR